MGSEWGKTTLGEIVELKRGYDLPKKQRKSGHVPVISSAGKSDEHEVAKVSGPGVVTGRYGTIGEVYYCEEDYWPLNTTLYVCDFKGNHRKFIYYFLKTLNYLEYSDKAAVPGVNRNHLHLAEVRIPKNILEQKAIAHILGTLDDKIELNRKMNETLESIAQALFKSWFVDFDPVIDKALAAGNPIPEPLHARAETRRALGNSTQPLPAHIQKLFPDAFQFDEEMGWIPEGWEIDSIKNRAATVQYGFTQSSSEEEVGPHFLRITDIRGGQVSWQTVPFCEATEDEIEKYRIIDGDIFVARTGASTGENIYIVDPPKAVFASYLVRFQFESRGIGRCVGQYMRSPAFFNHVAGTLGGSAQPNASAQALAAVNLLFPDEQVANAFFELVRGYDLKRVANESESNSLTKLRDTLLPKLLSGELRIPDAEKLVANSL